MSSRVEPGTLAGGSHTCSHCGKSFPRLCDLNKHAKSHSRPFKCAVASCKYHEHGWPTAKELERHVNDKHSSAPRVFPCLFERCTYTSKRESNCKQHMEKAHAWKYVRSKSNGKRIGTAGQGYHLKAELSPSDETGACVPRSLPTPGADFVLYPPDGDQSVILGEDDDELYLGYDDSQGPESQVYLPWTSPMTRLRKNESVIEMFTQTYHGVPERSPADGRGDSLVDPRLSHYSPIDALGQRMFENRNMLAASGSIKAEATSTVMDRLSSIKRKSDTESVSGDSTSERPNRTAAHTSGSQASHVHSLDFSGSTTSQSPHASRSPFKFSGDHRRSYDEEDSRPPVKKLRINDAEDFTDTSMPDIFRFAHPQIYDRDQKEKYSPCHSLHRDISTLVRHLSRPAHRLKVTDRAISSFDVEDEDFHHPRVGLCRRCWSKFQDRQSFDHHIEGSCDKVSKGKREKWRILLNSFTPLVTESEHFAQPPSTFEHADEEVEANHLEESSFSVHDDPDALGDPASPPTSPPSPTLSLETGTSRGAVPAKDFVPITEHRKLQQELQEKHQQLEKVTKVLKYALGNIAQAPLLALRTGRPSGPKSVAASGSTAQTEVPDQDNLFRHMDSQSTDVDIEGLMHEAQETLSRQNSDLSTASRSTIHHVPTSPPPLLPDESTSDEKCNPGELQKDSLAKPESLADSAYHTDTRRGSLGEIIGAVGADLDNRLLSENYHRKMVPMGPMGGVAYHTDSRVMAGAGRSSVNQFQADSCHQHPHNTLSEVKSSEKGHPDTTEMAWASSNPFEMSATQPYHHSQHTFNNEDPPAEAYDPSFHFYEHEHDYSSPRPLDFDFSSL
ncbi:hypothetical protein B0H63DRAFT_526424 [Podospora didyma]|uniref:C2H2-type domain-containing protein n=1 Tax=Podospora didyma TaxID=330526 RepID=A0AAE0NA76_9PEZI|nr:hypothetical protein B0H63DRAFT_526424 [Podospora didyma]